MGLKIDVFGAGKNFGVEVATPLGNQSSPKHVVKSFDAQKR